MAGEASFVVDTESFIYVKENALDGENCQRLINDGELFLQAQNSCNPLSWTGDHQFSQGHLGRSDSQISCPDALAPWYPKITELVMESLREYASSVSAVRNEPLISPSFKWQKTEVGGGYHVWHIEQGPGLMSNRYAVWMIYLNDVNEGGETEFLYQKVRLKPKTGTLVIWPAGLTHPHRGNPPYSNTKYVCTGWYVQPSNEIYAQAVSQMGKQMSGADQ